MGIVAHFLNGVTTCRTRTIRKRQEAAKQHAVRGGATGDFKQGSWNYTEAWKSYKKTANSALTSFWCIPFKCKQTALKLVAGSCERGVKQLWTGVKQLWAWGKAAGNVGSNRCERGGNTADDDIDQHIQQVGVWTRVVHSKAKQDPILSLANWKYA